MNYQQIISNPIPCDMLWHGTSFQEEYIMDEIFAVSKSNTITIRATKKSLIKIVNKIFPYIYLNMVKTEIIEENINESDLNYYFVYDNDKLIFLIKINV